MRMLHSITVFLLTVIIIVSSVPAMAEGLSSAREQAVSETLDVWRDAQYEHLFEKLSHRGKISREQFVNKMRETSMRPTCCWQKMQDFRVVSDKRTTATVYAKIGMEGDPTRDGTVTREFKLNFEGGAWKMQLNDIYALAGANGKKKRSSHKKSGYHR